MDQKVLEAQQWLNTTYGGRSGYSTIPENGRTGTVVMEALVTALQIDLGLSSPTGFFGSQTAAVYNNCKISKGSVDSNNNLVKILQYGLFCKGYNPTGATGSFGDGTESAILQLQRDAGLDGSQISSTVSATVFKAVLSSDALVLISGGDNVIRTIQQALNHDFLDYIGIMPCDGVYGGNTAKALVYGLQALGGMSTSVANGNFGPGTTAIAADHPQSSAYSEAEFVKLAKYALYCNGSQRHGGNRFDTSEQGGSFTGAYTQALTTAATAFQQFAGLNQTGSIDQDTWMSLLCSKGNPDRSVRACDCSTQLNDAKAQKLADINYDVVGRYLTGTVSGNTPKNLTKEELNIIFSKGLRVFAIYQDEKEYYTTHPNEETTVNYYNYNQGYNDAEKAVAAAVNLGIPNQEILYFAVDYDFVDSEVSSKIIPHFKGINDYIRTHGSRYAIGVYGPRNVCIRICERAYAVSSFVSDMSTGYSGNLGYILPANWAFDQIKELDVYASDGSFAVDNDAYSGRYDGFDHIVSGTQSDVSGQELALEKYERILQFMDFMPETGIAFGNEYKFDAGIFEVTIAARYGSKFNEDSTLNPQHQIVTDGTVSEDEWSAVVQIVEGMQGEVGLTLASDGHFAFAEDIQWQIQNGYISYGYGLNDQGKLSFQIIIHIDAASSGESAAGDINNFMEIEIDIVTKDVLTQQVRQAYDDMQEEAQGTTESGVDIGKIAQDVCCAILWGAVAGLYTVLVIETGGAAAIALPALFEGISWSSRQLATA